MRFRRSWLLLAGTPLACLGLSVMEVGAAVTFESALSVQETYNDNLFFTERDKEDDFGTFISPSLTLTYESRDVVLGGTYSGILQLFVNHPNENTYSHNSNFNIDFPGLTKRYKGLEVQVIESFNFTPQLEAFSFGGEPGQQPISAATGAAPGTSGTTGIGQVGQVGQLGGITRPGLSNQGLFTRRSDAFQNLAGFRLRYAWTRRVSPSLSYRNRLLLFERDDFQDSVNHLADVGFNYPWSPRTEWRVTYGVNITDFRGGGTGSSDDFVSHSATIGARHQLSRTLSFNGNIGASITESDVRFNGDLGAAKTYTQGSYSLRSNQSITPGGGLAADATLNQSIVGTIDHRFTRRLSGFLQVGLSRNDSLDSNDIDTLTYQVGTRFRSGHRQDAPRDQEQCLRRECHGSL